MHGHVEGDGHQRQGRRRLGQSLLVRMMVHNFRRDSTMQGDPLYRVRWPFIHDIMLCLHSEVPITNGAGSIRCASPRANEALQKDITKHHEGVAA